MDTNTTTDNKSGLQEVVIVETPKQDTETKKNPSLAEFTQNVNLTSLGGALLGGVAVGFVPKVLKWDSGIKDVAASLAVTLLGGYLMARFISKQAAYGFVLVGATLVAVKGLRMLLGKTDSLLGSVSDVGNTGELIYGEDLIYGVGQDEVYSENELFGVGQESGDVIVPTADADY